MITRTTEKLFREAIFLSKWSGSTAFRWDSENHRIRLSTTPWSKFYSNFNFVLILAFEIFLIYRLIESIAIPTAGRPLSEIVTLCYFICIYAIPTTLYHCTTKHSTDIPLFVNGFLEYFENFKESYMIPSQYRKKNGCETVLRIFFNTAYLITLQNVIVFAIAPHRFFMLTSLIWDSKDAIPFIMKVVFLAVHLQIWMSAWSHALLYTTVIYSYIYPTLWILKELNRRTRNPGTFDVLRSQVGFSNTYRGIQILQNMFNYCFQHEYFSYQKILVSAVAVFGFYGAVRIHGSRAVLMTMIGVMFSLHLSVMFRQLGKFYDISTEILNSWKGSSSKKILKSCRPLRVQISDYYCVQKTTILVLMGVIINAAITLLLSS
ncbi:unnamed protein product [Allacma fusca]|uniref:Uncharacterized protein n=1 Tax=Allacma fusca TaxID=39272 RepID=A0A8J2JMW3_9HEXA|nr:unnamed protein product [Allacma fusca]